ncbi:hypothetical protein ACFL4G_03690 [Thermodesulfobacteriota bacterium]
MNTRRIQARLKKIEDSIGSRRTSNEEVHIDEAEIEKHLNQMEPIIMEVHRLAWAGGTEKNDDYPEFDREEWRARARREYIERKIRIARETPEERVRRLEGERYIGKFVEQLCALPTSVPEETECGSSGGSVN